MQNYYYNKLLDLLISEGAVDWIKFDQMAGDVLKEAGYQESDLENMSVGDVKERIEEMFKMKLEEEGDDILLVEYINE